MKPLREEHDSVDPKLAAAARLLERVGPLAHSRLTQRRVRHQIEYKYDHEAARALRPAVVVVGISCGLAATAGAAWGVLQATSSREHESSLLEAPVIPRVAPAPAKGSGSPSRPWQPVQEPSAVEPVVEPPAPTPRAPARPVVEKPSKPTRAAAASEAALVHRAVKELRGGGDPQRARQLLEQYRAANPTGELAEEALVLSIEAAVADGDPDARRLARQYLAKYPGGRFVAAARRVLR